MKRSNDTDVGITEVVTRLGLMLDKGISVTFTAQPNLVLEIGRGGGTLHDGGAPVREIDKSEVAVLLGMMAAVVMDY